MKRFVNLRIIKERKKQIYDLLNGGNITKQNKNEMIIFRYKQKIYKSCVCINNTIYTEPNRHH